MAIAIQIIAVFFVSALLIFLLYKGWSPILTPILMAALLFLISGQNVMEALSGTFLNGFIQIVPMFMLFLIVGSIMGSLIAQSGAAQTIADTLFTVFAQKRDGKGRVVISGVIAMFAFISGAPGCMLILAPVFVPLAAQMGISAAGMMRIAVFGQSVLDTLPNNGAIIVTLGIAGIKMKDGYPGIFKTTVIYMFIGTVIVTVLAMLFPGLA